MTKTNVMRLLEAAGIAYRTAEYEYDEANLSGLHAAEQVGMDAEQVFKTLVTRGDKTGILVFCIPAQTIHGYSAVIARMRPSNSSRDGSSVSNVIGVSIYCA